MPITRRFLDWGEPALPAVADYLLDQYTILGVVDFGNTVIVMPGSRAGRRLLEILVDRADQSAFKLTPPRIETMGRLPELLYEPKRPFASDLLQKLAWGHALRKVERRLVSRVIPHLPAEGDIARWMSLGELLWRQHRELAADGLDFSDVARSGAEVEGFDEAERWRILRKIQEEYLQTLDALGLWDLQTARLFAIKHHECRTEKEILLVGTVDMSRAMRDMLDQVAGQVTALIHAPQRLSKRFDVHGCIDPEAWQQTPLELELKQVRVVDGPADQADAVARAIAAFDGRYRADEITIGMTDESLVPQVQRQLSQCEIPSRWVVGKSLPETSPYQLLKAVANYVDRGSFSDFAALVRHADVYDWLEQQGVEGNWLAQLDAYFSVHLAPRLGTWLGAEEEFNLIKPIHEAVQALVAPLSGEPRTLGDWTPPIVDLLLNVFSNVELDVEHPTERITIAAFREAHKVLVEHTAIPDLLAPLVSAAQALRLTLEQLDAQVVPPLPDPTAIELLGWLELPLDDAPALIVTTFNEGHVPKSQNADLFLPNGLRRHLGVVDNARRYARDAYALSVLLAARKELTLIVARRDPRGDPLAPSRLLFATDPKQIAQRVLAFFEPQASEPRPPLAGALTATRARSGFQVPQPQRLPQPITAVSVTAFRSYLACPYRYYLGHVLKLIPVSDEARELDARLFGNLIHEVLKRFGQHDIRESTSANDIRRFLHAALEACVVEWYGAERLAPVHVQIMQLRARLDAFAEWQAEWARQGWRIAHTEEGKKPARLNLDGGRSMALYGRIDRIDVNRRENRWMIFDYKTGDNAKTPDQVHRKSGAWVDLQLPLYRHLAKPLGVSGEVSLGYIALQKDVSNVSHLLADWSSDDLADADATAARVANDIYEQKFWPPTEPAPTILTDFASICQAGVFDREVAR